MAGSVNKVILVGHLGADPEVRSLNSGDQVANLRIATSESWRDRQTGERKDRTEWHSIVIFNENLVKVAEQYLKKGAKVYLEGALQTRKWQDQNGNDRYTTEIVLQKFRGELQMLDRKSDDNDDSRQDDRRSNSSNGYSEQSGSMQNYGSQNYSRDLDDEIPF